MPDYSNPNTRLTAGRYEWGAKFARGPLRHGDNPAQDIEGTLEIRPGATVGSLLAQLTAWYAQSNGISAAEVSTVLYSLREK